MMSRLAVALLFLGSVQGFTLSPTRRTFRNPSLRRSIRMDMFDPQLPLQLLVCAGMLGTGNRIRSSEALKAQASATLEPGTYDAIAGVQPGQEVDIFRDTPLRYMGYANECGEAFRPLVPLWAVLASYGVAVSYVLADAAYKSVEESRLSGVTNGVSGRAIAIAVDVLVFQLLASVICPGYTINRWVALIAGAVSLAEENGALQKLSLDDGTLQLLVEWTPTLAGLALIPLIVKPLDALVDAFLDKTLRPAMESMLVK